MDGLESDGGQSNRRNQNSVAELDDQNASSTSAMDTDGQGESENEQDNSDIASENDTGTEAPPSPIKLPDRATRGKRLHQVVNEDEEAADKQFWQQEFFAEEKADENYSTESEEEDVPDTDFEKSESEEDEGAGAEQDDRVRDALRLKKSAKKPPGWKQAAQRRAHQRRLKKLREEQIAAKEPSSFDAPEDTAIQPSTSDAIPSSPPKLRQSTYNRVQEDELKRQAFAQHRRSAAPKSEKPEPESLSMDDVLLKAAHHEIKNKHELARLEAKEEEAKRRATHKQKRAMGPCARISSYAERRPDCALVATTALSFVDCEGLIPEQYRPRDITELASCAASGLVLLGDVVRPRTVRFPTECDTQAPLLGVPGTLRRYGDPASVPWHGLSAEGPSGHRGAVLGPQCAGAGAPGGSGLVAGWHRSWEGAISASAASHCPTGSTAPPNPAYPSAHTAASEGRHGGAALMAVGQPYAQADVHSARGSQWHASPMMGASVHRASNRHTGGAEACSSLHQSSRDACRLRQHAGADGSEAVHLAPGARAGVPSGTLADAGAGLRSCQLWPAAGHMLTSNSTSRVWRGHSAARRASDREASGLFLPSSSVALAPDKGLGGWGPHAQSPTVPLLRNGYMELSHGTSNGTAARHSDERLRSAPR